MSEQIPAYNMSAPTIAPDGNGLPRRNGSRGLLPSTWMGRPIKLIYVGVDGKGVETTGTLLDWCGTGPIFDLAGGKALVAWEWLVLLELVSD